VLLHKKKLNGKEKEMVIRIVLAVALFLLLIPQEGSVVRSSDAHAEAVGLPRVYPDAGCLETVLYERRSVREFSKEKLSLEQIAKLLFAGQGVNRPKGYRTVPSAGALFPLELFLVAGSVQDLEPGVYRYRPLEHDLVRTTPGDRRGEVAEACLGQRWMATAPAQIVISAVYERVTRRYGQRGIQYVHMESGAASQSISLEAASLGLGTTLVGAFQDQALQELIGSRSDEHPLLVLPVGFPR
jgi:SagB-type dehydrogenase family enzyme